MIITNWQIFPTPNCLHNLHADFGKHTLSRTCKYTLNDVSMICLCWNSHAKHCNRQFELIQLALTLKIDINIDVASHLSTQPRQRAKCFLNFHFKRNWMELVYICKQTSSNRCRFWFPLMCAFAWTGFAIIHFQAYIVRQTVSLWVLLIDTIYLNREVDGRRDDRRLLADKIDEPQTNHWIEYLRFILSIELPFEQFRIS